MLPLLAAVGLVFAVAACGGGERDARELREYVARMRQADPLNQRVAELSLRLDQPANEITAEDLVQARELVERYIAEMEEASGSHIGYQELRIVHDLYLRKLAEARDLAADTGRDLRRERGNVAIALRHIEKLTRQHHKALDVLWLRTDQPTALALQWPE
ncbi:MAG: hypothetical protein AB1505_02980 [Candidatus Latescibacterota bacterium]